MVMTHNQLPLFIMVYSGNQHDSQLLIPCAKQLNKIDGIKRFILCGDSAYNSSTNNYYLAGKNITNRFNNGYVFSRPISNNDLEWILNPNGWVDFNGEFIKPEIITELFDYELNPEETELSKEAQKLKDKPRFKENNTSRTDHVWNHGKTRKIPVEVNLKQIAFFNPKLLHRKTKTIERNIQKVLSFQQNPKKAKTAVKKAASPYAKVRAGKTNVSLDEEKVIQEMKKAGYYLIETSEKNLPAKIVSRIYSDKKWIEFNFRTWKSDLKLHPLWVRKTGHIRAIILIRYCALVVIKILQFLLGYKFSPRETIKSLKKFRCVQVKNQYKVIGRNELIKDLEQIFDVHFSKNMSRTELKANFTYEATIFGSTAFCGFCDPFSNKTKKIQKLKLRSKMN